MKFLTARVRLFRRNTKKDMAKVEFPDFIKSASGTISRKRLPDGSIRSIVVNKHGRMYETTYHPRTKISPEERARRKKFGVISSAFAFVQREMEIESDPTTRRRIYGIMGGIYDRMVGNGKEPNAKMIASSYVFLYW